MNGFAKSRANDQSIKGTHEENLSFRKGSSPPFDKIAQVIWICHFYKREEKQIWLIAGQGNQIIQSEDSETKWVEEHNRGTRKKTR